MHPPQREYRADGSYVESDVMEHEDATPAEALSSVDGAAVLTEGVMRERLAEIGARARVRI